MTVLIIEDEAAAARRLEKMVLEIEPDAIIPGKPDSVESAVEWLSSNPAPDLILMDIHLADGYLPQLTMNTSFVHSRKIRLTTC